MSTWAATYSRVTVGTTGSICALKVIKWFSFVRKTGLIDGLSLFMEGVKSPFLHWLMYFLTHCGFPGHQDGLCLFRSVVAPKIFNFGSGSFFVFLFWHHSGSDL